MKKMLLILLYILAWTNYTCAEQVWYNGYVKGVSNDSITIDATKYQIDKDMRIVKHISKKDAIYEIKAEFKDIKAGDSVSIRVDNKKIYEIIIEQYKNITNK